MPYLPQYKTIFVHIPKCAGTSVENWFKRFTEVRLRDEFVDPALTAGWSVSAYQAKTMHLNIVDIAGFSGVDLSSVYSFAVVRNPYSRLLSHYKFMRKNYADIHDGRIHWDVAAKYDKFGDFVKALADDITLIKIFSQLEYVIDEHSNIAVQDLLKFENLDRDFKKIKIQLFRTNPCYALRSIRKICSQLPRKNTLGKYHWQEEYNEKTAECIYSLYSTEFERLGYDADSWKNRNPVY